MPDKPEAKASQDWKPSEAERKVIAAAAAGKPCKLGKGDPAGGGAWGEERTVRAKCVYDLCCGTRSDWPVHAKGVRIKGARIVGKLDFEDAKLLHPLHLVSCRIEKKLVLRRAHARSIKLTGSLVPGIHAELLRVDNSLEMDGGFSASSAVRLSDAKIGGDLDCKGGSFEGDFGDVAFAADGLRCGGSVYLGTHENEDQSMFSATGEVRFSGAIIEKTFECDGGDFSNEAGTALDADNATFQSDVSLADGFSARGEVRVSGASVGGNLECSGGSFQNPRGDALSADRLDCHGDMRLGEEFRARGTVRLSGARIKGQFNCRHASFERPECDDMSDEPALLADTVDCGGDVLLNGQFRATGRVSFLGATLSGELTCSGASFENPQGTALDADLLACKDDLQLNDGFQAKGAVQLAGATIGGSLICSGGSFENPGGDALNADRLDCRGNVQLRWASVDGVRKEFRARGTVALSGATIKGQLDCSDGSFEKPEGDDKPALLADTVDCGGDVFLSGQFRARGRVSFLGATLGGELTCSEADFENPQGIAFAADRLECKDDLQLDADFRAKGAVQLTGATIGGSLICSGGIFEDPGGEALNADRLDCHGNVWLRDEFWARGTVRLHGATIKGQLDCSDGSFERPEGDDKPALLADTVDCGGDVFLSGQFRARGRVSFLGATLGGELTCHGADFENPQGTAFAADRLECKEDLQLVDGFRAKGAVRLAGVTLGGDLNCSDGTFERSSTSGPFNGDEALLADDLDCGGNVFLNEGFRAKGRVSFTGATVTGDFESGGGSFENPRGRALSAARLDCKGDVNLNEDFRAKGTVELSGGTIGNDLDCSDGVFERPEDVGLPNEPALQASNLDCRGDVLLSGRFLAKGTVRLLGANVQGKLKCDGGPVEVDDGDQLPVLQQHPREYSLDLTDARARAFYDKKKSWPEQSNLILDGFRYSTINPLEVESRKEWLRLTRFRNQPYAQLAEVLEERGRSEDAKEIRIEQQRRRRAWLWKEGRKRNLSQTLAMLWLGFIGPTLGFGYRPRRALWALLALFLFGLALFGEAYKQGIMAPSDALVASSWDWLHNRKLDGEHKDYPSFSALIYSLDTMLPLIDLGMEAKWHPSAARLTADESMAWWWQLVPTPSRYLPWHIGLGWGLATFAAAGFSGIIRRE